MKIFLKILYFIFIMIATVGEVHSSTVVNILQKGISYSFYQESKFCTSIFKNHFEKFCINGEKVVVYSERVTSIAAKAAKGGGQVGKNVFTVTKEGVVLPKGAKIPSEFIENTSRGASFGVKEGRFIEKVRIDPGTPPGFKGPNESHFHLNNKGHIFDPNKWPWCY